MSQAHTPEPLILVIEDDLDLVDVLLRLLTSNGYQVAVATSAAEARAALDRLAPQLILLDIVLPDADGLVLAANINSLSSVPIVILSARARQADRVLGLKLGADDFVAKPFDIDELLARIGAVLRRSTPPRVHRSSAERIHLGDLTIVPSRASVTIGNRPIHFTPTEYRLLYALAVHVNQIVSREDLISQVWGFEDSNARHLVDVQIGRVRKKLHVQGLRTPQIVTKRGQGFSLAFTPSERTEGASPRAVREAD